MPVTRSTDLSLSSFLPVDVAEVGAAIVANNLRSFGMLVSSWAEIFLLEPLVETSYVVAAVAGSGCCPAFRIFPFDADRAGPAPLTATAWC